MKNFTMVVFATAVLAVASGAGAQTYIGYMPAAPVPAVSYYSPAPVVGYGPVVATSYYAPQTVYYSAPAPYYVAAPVATPYYVASPYVPAPVAMAPVYYGRPVIVRPKVYIPGQPVRNVFRAVTP
jgi:hypothetical protein